MKIFLFDMDGVLLESRGYHLALQETVRRMARSLGFGEVTLSPDDIAAFEAGGITSEWDEAAISTALLLETVWMVEPDRRLSESLALPKSSSPNPQPAPDFNALARSLSAPGLLLLHPLERAERFFLDADRHTPAQDRLLRGLIRGARTAERSLTHRTFQELVLGSAEFARTYGLPAVLNCESYLLKYDLSNLSPMESACLRDWMYAHRHAAAVITSRPSHPPAGVFSTPEAELGAALVGLDGIPICGWGGMCWLGMQRHADPQTFLKPSPVHTLAALRMALGEGQEIALAGAAYLAETGQTGPAWQRLEGAQVCVFEDTPGGIKSLHAARQVLDRAGIHIETKSFGIARKPVKVQALRVLGAQIFPSLIEALDIAFVK
jgi:hypothetical protein